MADSLIQANTPRDGIELSGESDHPTATDTADTADTIDATDAALAVRSHRWLNAVEMAEGGLLLDVGVIIDLASIYLPVLGTVFLPAVPAPFALLYLRRGMRASLLAAVVSAFLVTVLVGPHFGWRMGFEAIIGILLGLMMRRRAPTPLIWLVCALLVTTVGYAATFAVVFVLGYPIENIPLQINNSLHAFDGMVTAAAHLVGLSAAWLSFRPTAADIGRLLFAYWPVAYYLYLLLYALPTTALYYLVSNSLLRVFGFDVPPFPPRWVFRLLSILLLPTRPFLWLFGRRRKRDEDDDSTERKERAA